MLLALTIVMFHLFDNLQAAAVEPETFFVANGRDAQPYEYPSVVPIYLCPTDRKLATKDFLCTGSLITPTHVLTAAHCLLDASVDREAFCRSEGHGTPKIMTKLCLAFHGDTSTEPPSFLGGRDLVYKSKKLHIYEELTTKLMFDVCTGSRDLAIIELETPVDLSRVIFTRHKNKTKKEIPVKLMKLIEANETIEMGKSLAAGWGSTESKNSPTWLQAAIVDDIPYAECHKTWMENYNNPVLKASLCTAASSGVDTCQGDSGGPLMKKLNGTITQIGVLSYGHTGDCGASGDDVMPAVFADLTFPAYHCWIENIVGEKNLL